LIDTPPLNVEIQVARRMLEVSDVVVPVLKVNSYDQISRFMEKDEFRVRFAVINMVPRVKTLELKEIMDILEGFLRGTPLRREDVIFVPHDHTLNTCTVRGYNGEVQEVPAELGAQVPRPSLERRDGEERGILTGG